MKSDERIRLNKFLSMTGVASRRGADDLILEGCVQVNGTVVTALGIKIDPAHDKVFVKGRQAVLLDEPIYVVFNKPKDCITTASDERGRTTVMDYVRIKKRIFPIGRLDRNTTGVLLLTNDGEFANRIMHPKFGIRKAYRVTLSGELKPADASQIRKGVRLSDGKTAPAELVNIAGGKNRVFGVVIREGKNRQIHRMFRAMGYEVEKLDRVAYGGITYEGLPRGRWRYLTGSEVLALKEAAGE